MFISTHTHTHTHTRWQWRVRFNLFLVVVAVLHYEFTSLLAAATTTKQKWVIIFDMGWEWYIILRDKLIVCLRVIDTCVRRQTTHIFFVVCSFMHIEGLYNKSNRLDKVKPHKIYHCIFWYGVAHHTAIYVEQIIL